MKNIKYLFIIVILVIAFVLFKSTIYKNNSNEILLGDSYALGDINGDGKVNSSDYILVRAHILKTKELTGEELRRADVDGKNGITSVDYILIRKIIIGVDISSELSQNNSMVLKISQMGAKCDGITDDTDAINNALKYASEHEISTVDMGNGTCKISKTLHVYCNSSSTNSNVRRKLTITGNATFIHDVSQFISIHAGCDKVSINNITSSSLYSPYKRDRNGDGVVNDNDSVSHIVNLSSNKSLKLEMNNVTLDGGNVGLSLSEITGIDVNNSIFKNMYFRPESGRGGYGILFQGCKNVSIKNSKFITNEYFRHGIYVSVSSESPQNENVLIDNCVFDYSGIKPVDFDKLKYPSDKLYEGIKKSHIWSPDTTPIMVRKTNNITISNCKMINTPNISVLTAENGAINNINIKNVTLQDPIYRDGEYNYGVYFKGNANGSQITWLDGTIDNLQITGTIPNNYKYLAAIQYSKVKFNNISSNMPIYDITPNYSQIDGFTGKIEK